MTRRIELRNVIASDLPLFFEQQLDPAANRMAAFTSRDPSDRKAFDDHWEKILSDEAVVVRTIVLDGQVVGHVASYERSGKPEVTYWLGSAYWGQGIATEALSEFLGEFRVRPLYAGAAVDNVASLRVLQKCGFTVTGRERGFANARNEEIDEMFLVLP